MFLGLNVNIESLPISESAEINVTHIGMAFGNSVRFYVQAPSEMSELGYEDLYIDRQPKYYIDATIVEFDDENPDHEMLSKVNINTGTDEEPVWTPYVLVWDGVVNERSEEDIKATDDWKLQREAEIDADTYQLIKSWCFAQDKCEEYYLRQDRESDDFIAYDAQVASIIASQHAIKVAEGIVEE